MTGEYAASHVIIGRGPDQAVGGRDGASDAGRAAAPGRRAPVAVPGGTLDHVVAVRQGSGADAHVIVGQGADQAVVGRDGAADAGRAAAPGRRAPGAVPEVTPDHVVAVRQSGDAEAYLIIGQGADQAVGVRDGAADADRAAAPGRRAPMAVPEFTQDQVVAVRQGDGAVNANGIIGQGADQAVGVRDGAADAGRAAAPGRRPAGVVPGGTQDHVVAA